MTSIRLAGGVKLRLLGKAIPASRSPTEMSPEMASTTTSGTAGRLRVPIVGAGFGGLATIGGLRHTPVDVTVVDRTNHAALS